MREPGTGQSIQREARGKRGKPAEQQGEQQSTESILARDARAGKTGKCTQQAHRTQGTRQAQQHKGAPPRGYAVRRTARTGRIPGVRTGMHRDAQAGAETTGQAGAQCTGRTGAGRQPGAGRHTQAQTRVPHGGARARVGWEGFTNNRTRFRRELHAHPPTRSYA